MHGLDPTAPRINGGAAKGLHRVTAEVPPRPRFGEYGDSGTARQGGTISGYERNSRLRGVRRWADLAEEMLAVDPKLAQAEDTIRRTLLTAEWYFDPGRSAKAPGPAGDRARRIADLFNKQWGFDGGTSWMTEPWEDQLSRMLRYVAIGFRYSEEVYGVRDGSVYLSRYADREPSAHNRWIWSEDGTTWVGVEQTPPSPFWDPRRRRDLAYFIPAAKLVLLSFARTGQNLEGRGALRPCWQWYSYKQHALDLLAIGAERWAIPTPHLKFDRQAAADAGYSPSEIDAAFTDAKTSAARYMAGEEAWLSSSVGIDFDTFGAGQFDPAGLLRTIDHANQEMMSALGQGHQELGFSEVGSRSLGTVLQEQQTLTAVNILDTVAGAISGTPRPGGGTVGRLCRWNFPDVGPDEYPILRHRGIKVDQLGELLPHIPNLINSGALTPDDRLEAGIRRLGGVDEAGEPREYVDRLGARAQQRTSNYRESGAVENALPPGGGKGEG